MKWRFFTTRIDRPDLKPFIVSNQSGGYIVSNNGYIHMSYGMDGNWSYDYLKNEVGRKELNLEKALKLLKDNCARKKFCKQLGIIYPINPIKIDDGLKNTIFKILSKNRATNPDSAFKIPDDFHIRFEDKTYNTEEIIEIFDSLAEQKLIKSVKDKYYIYE